MVNRPARRGRLIRHAIAHADDIGFILGNSSVGIQIGYLTDKIIHTITADECLGLDPVLTASQLGRIANLARLESENMATIDTIATKTSDNRLRKDRWYIDSRSVNAIVWSYDAQTQIINISAGLEIFGLVAEMNFALEFPEPRQVRQIERISGFAKHLCRYSTVSDEISNFFLGDV